MAVTEGGTTEVDFSVVPAAVSLEEVVTTATGERERRREIGSAVSTVKPKEEQLASAQNVSQLLTGKVPGVDVAQAGGTIGSGSRIRIRGASSLSLTNEPLIAPAAGLGRCRAIVRCACHNPCLRLVSQSVFRSAEASALPAKPSV